jgi:TatD DNase family protein
MELIDTHCHLHDPEFFKSRDAEEAVKAAIDAGVTKLLGIGTSLADSKNTIKFAYKHPRHYWASIGIHPHEASNLTDSEIDQHLIELEKLASDPKVVAVGECGFDFYYHKRREMIKKQTRLLVGQLEIAKKYDLPVSFHVRGAYDDFWEIYDQFKVTGVLHSFTDTKEHMKQALQRGLLFGINGIATFTKDLKQIEMFKLIPLESMILETDAPFLTPVPKRGTINTPENVIYITKFMAELRGEDVRTVASATTANARKLFGL